METIIFFVDGECRGYKTGGGPEKVLAMLKGGGAQQNVR